MDFGDLRGGLFDYGTVVGEEAVDLALDDGGRWRDAGGNAFGFQRDEEVEALDLAGEVFVLVFRQTAVAPVPVGGVPPVACDGAGDWRALR